MRQSEILLNVYAEGAPVAQPHPNFHRKVADPDYILVEALRRQDATAPDALVAAYGSRLYRLAIRLTANRSDAEEVVQDALWTATSKIDTFRGDAAFGSWLYRITANAAYQKLRGRRRAGRVVLWDDIVRSFNNKSDLREPLRDWSPNLADPTVDVELRSVLSSAINDLPDDYRIAFVLRDVEGLTNADIALALGVTLTTVRSRVHRARLFLRARLTKYLAPAHS
jgi:RNA polymerase sigma-70 factor (ECF subfamily)